MTDPIAYVPVSGTWVRQVPARREALPARPRPTDGRFHRAGQVAVYLADSEATAWAEWYRWLAEWGEPPLGHVPRALYEVAVDLDKVVDLASSRARRAAGVPERMRPASTQWRRFQERVSAWMADGAQGVIYASAARTRSLCVCVFEPGLSGLRIEDEPVRVIAPPPPPRGLRT